MQDDPVGVLEVAHEWVCATVGGDVNPDGVYIGGDGLSTPPSHFV